MIRKFFAFLLLALFSVPAITAKRTESPDTISAVRAFLELDVMEIPLLQRTNREQLIETYDSVGYTILNDMMGETELDTITANFLEVHPTGASTVQFKVLKIGNGNDIVMTLYTVGGDKESADTDIKFYDAFLNPLPADKYFSSPKLSDFFDTKGYKTKMKEIEQMLPFYTVVYEANPDNSDIKARLTYSDRLTIEDQKILELFVKPEIIYNWDGKKFKLSK